MTDHFEREGLQSILGGKEIFERVGDSFHLSIIPSAYE